MKEEQQDEVLVAERDKSKANIEKIENTMESMRLIIDSDVNSEEYTSIIKVLRQERVKHDRILELSENLRRERKYKNAIRILEEVPVTQSASIAAKLGECLLLDGQPIRAVEQYNQAVKLAPGFEKTFWFQKNLAKSFFYAGETEKSSLHFNRALELCEGDFEKYQSLQKYFISACNLDTFISAVNAAYLHKAGAEPDLIDEIQSQQAECTKSILVFDSCVPRYDQDAGSVLMQGFVRSLVTSGYKVWFYSGEAECEHKYITRLLEIGAKYLDNNFFNSPEEMIRAVAPETDMFMLTRVETGGRYFEFVRQETLEKPIIFNTVDLHYLRTQRHYESAGSMNTLLEAKRLKRREAYLVRNADATIIISDAEQKILNAETILGNVWQIPIIVEFPEETPVFAGRKNMAFIGSYSHLPNIDAVDHFCQNVWPEIYAQFPDEQLLIVGPNAPSRWKDQYHGMNNVLIEGFVENIQDFLSTIKCTVVPLRIGAGQKGKIATSLAHGVPCLSSPVGVEGMNLRDGSEVLVCENKEEWAGNIERIFNDEELWNQLSSQGRSHAFEYYSEQRVGKLLVDRTDDLLVSDAHQMKKTA